MIRLATLESMLESMLGSILGSTRAVATGFAAVAAMAMGATPSALTAHPDDGRSDLAVTAPDILRFSREVLDRVALDAVERCTGDALSREVGMILRTDYLTDIDGLSSRFTETGDDSAAAVRQLRHDLLERSERVWADATAVVGDDGDAVNDLAAERRAWLRRQWLDAPRAATSFFPRGIDLIAFIREDPLTTALRDDPDAVRWPVVGGDGPNDRTRAFTVEAIGALMAEYDRDITETIERVRRQAIELRGADEGRRRFALAGETYSVFRTYAERVMAVLRQAVPETAVLLWAHRLTDASDPFWFGQTTAAESLLLSRINVSALALGAESGGALVDAWLRNRWRATAALQTLQASALRDGRSLFPTPDESLTSAVRELRARLDDSVLDAVRRVANGDEVERALEAPRRWAMWIGDPPVEP